MLTTKRAQGWVPRAWHLLLALPCAGPLPTVQASSCVGHTGCSRLSDRVKQEQSQAEVLGWLDRCWVSTGITPWSTKLGEIVGSPGLEVSCATIWKFFCFCFLFLLLLFVLGFVLWVSGCLESGSQDLDRLPLN